MQNKPTRSIIPSQGGLWSELTLRVKLIGRLVLDPRVSFLVKLLPLGSLVYFVAPDFFPGPIDDALLTWLSFSLFLELCPSYVVAEHVAELTSNETLFQQAKNPKPGPDSDVVDGEVIDSDQ